jgi:Uncharacterized protein conserved in bacteria
VIVCRVSMTAADDYLERRAAHRSAHIERIVELRQRGFVLGGGPSPDGKTADIVYRVPQPGAIHRLVEEDPYWTGGVWKAWEPRDFAQFVEPWEMPPVVLDGSRQVSIVEGEAPDSEMASFALVEARGAGRMAFGGFFPGGSTWALMRSPDAELALADLEASGLWKPGSLTARPLLHVL